MGGCTPGPSAFWQAMATTAADVLVKGLIDWGVDTVLGIPGDQCQEIMAEAFTEDGPALIEATVDANEPPLGELRADTPHGRGPRSWHSRRSKNRKAAREGYDTSVDLKGYPMAKKRKRK
jgi:hypothetical protein